MMHQHAVTPSTRPLQKVAFVGRCSDDLLCDLMLGGTHDVVFVESLLHAYSCIKRVLPDVIVVALSEDDPDGCRVLSMLALDKETSRIPVLTCLIPGTKKLQRRGAPGIVQPPGRLRLELIQNRKENS
jgi:CheY-like chemotaxis protein